MVSFTIRNGLLMRRGAISWRSAFDWDRVIQMLLQCWWMVRDLLTVYWVLLQACRRKGLGMRRGTAWCSIRSGRCGPRTPQCPKDSTNWQARSLNFALECGLYRCCSFNCKCSFKNQLYVCILMFLNVLSSFWNRFGFDSWIMWGTYDE